MSYWATTVFDKQTSNRNQDVRFTSSSLSCCHFRKPCEEDNSPGRQGALALSDKVAMRLFLACIAAAAAVMVTSEAVFELAEEDVHKMVAASEKAPIVKSKSL